MKLLDKEYSDKDRIYYDQNRDEMLKYIPENVRSVLDVGCSSGSFGKALKKKSDCLVWGIEPDKGASEEASTILDKVYNTIFDEAVDLGDQKFDCIVFNDVLEHLVNPFDALELCKKYLTSNGILVCSIPNIRFFDALYHIIVQKDFQYTGAGIFDKTHLRFFTKKSIMRMFVQAGYKLQTIEGINSIKVLNYKGYKNFRILNTLLFNAIEDMEYLQFAVVVTK